MQLDGYVRVSDIAGRGGESFISPDVQREAILGWAKLHGHEIAVMHEELDVSGGKIDRPLLNKVMSRIEAGETEGVVVWKLDRFGRTLVGCLELLKRIQDAGGTFASVTDQFDLSTPNGRLVLNMMLSIAQFELERIGATWREARGRAIRRGVMTAPTPYGYRKRPDGRFEPDPVEAPIVREIFELRAAGGSWKAVGTWLVDAGVRSRRGNPLTTSTVGPLVRNEIYLGVVQDRVSGERLEGAHPPLIDLATWRAAQSRSSVRWHDGADSGDLLRGLVRCATCRYTTAAHTRLSRDNGGDAVHINCSRHPSRRGGDCPDPVHTRVSPLVREYKDGRDPRGLDEIVVDAVFERLDEIGAEAFGADTEVAELEAAWKSARAVLEDHAEDVELIEALGRDAYLKQSAKLRGAAESAEAAFNEAMRKNAGRLTQPVRRMRDDWDGLSLAERRELIASVIQTIFVRNGPFWTPSPLVDNIHIVWFDDEPVDTPRQGRRDYVMRPFIFDDADDPDDVGVAAG